MSGGSANEFALKNDLYNREDLHAQCNHVTATLKEHLYKVEKEG